MKKMIRSALVLLMVCMLTVLPMAMAETLTVEPGVKVTLEGTLPKTPETFTYTLTADSNSNPMPGGKTGGSAKTTVTGEGTGKFDVMSFDRTGVYTYTLKQEQGSNPDCIKYDQTVYQLKVSITNDGSGGLSKTVVLHKDGTEEKPDEALFHNVYKTVIEPTATPTPEQPKTGVEDTWPFYLAGAAFMLVIAGIMVGVLCRKDAQDEEK